MCFAVAFSNFSCTYVALVDQPIVGMSGDVMVAYKRWKTRSKRQDEKEKEKVAGKGQAQS